MCKMSSLGKTLLNIALGLTIVIAQNAIPCFDSFVSTDVFTFTWYAEFRSGYVMFSFEAANPYYRPLELLYV
jgi:hypothetical protein